MRTTVKTLQMKTFLWLPKLKYDIILIQLFLFETLTPMKHFSGYFLVLVLILSSLQSLGMVISYCNRSFENKYIEWIFTLSGI
jgi:hypothetical protein